MEVVKSYFPPDIGSFQSGESSIKVGEKNGQFSTITILWGSKANLQMNGGFLLCHSQPSQNIHNPGQDRI